jgi:hypothetical protein
MDIKLEQKLTAAYLALGAACGVLADYLATNAMLPYALLVPLVVYAATVTALARLMKGQKTSKLVSNSLMTFVLVWAVVWVFLFNI